MVHARLPVQRTARRQRHHLRRAGGRVSVSSASMRFRATAIQLATAAERHITIEPHAVAMPRSPDSCWTNSGTGQLFGAEHVLRAPHAQPWQRDVDLRVENAATVKVEPGRAIPAGERPSTPRGWRH